MRGSLTVLLFAAALSVSGLSSACAQDRTAPRYIGTDTCTECHQDAAEAWSGSHHAKAWTPVSPENVLGDFADARFTLNGITTRFYKDGETFMVETDGPTGRMTRYPVHSVVGIEPLQQYLLETEDGRLQSFDVVWDTEEQRWYPDSQNRTPHYGQIIAAGRANLRGTAERLAELAEYTEMPGIVRATALEMLIDVAYPALATRLAPLLGDPDPLVRAAAADVQRGAPDADRYARLAGLLSDPVKTVRIAAARNVLSVRIARMPETQTAQLNSAMREWQETLIAKTDFPETQMVLAGIALTTRRMDTALRAFGAATELDPQQVQAWIMMIRIHSALGNRQAALDTADRAIAANPDSIELNLLRSEL